VGKFFERVVTYGAAASQGLRVVEFLTWQTELDEALTGLPESELLSHELFRMLAMNPSPTRKRIFLVLEKDTPVAVAGLRWNETFWELLTNWILPGVLFPVKDGYIHRVLPALGVSMKVGWWRWNAPPPLMKWAGRIRSSPTHGIRYSEDFEQHWNQKFKKNLRQSKNRSKDLTWKVNAPDAAEWTIRNWGKKWFPSAIGEMAQIQDRILIARYLEERKRHYTHSMHDGDTIIAGATVIVHRDELVAQVIYRLDEYDWHGATNRLIELQFHWGKDMGFGGFDIGGGQDYKAHWAPPRSDKWEFDIEQGYRQFGQRFVDVYDKGKKIVSRILNKNTLPNSPVKP